MVFRYPRYSCCNWFSSKSPRQNFASLASVSKSSSTGVSLHEIIADSQRNVTTVNGWNSPTSSSKETSYLRDLPRSRIDALRPPVMPPLLLAHGGGSKPGPEDGEEISDQEWEIRTGMFCVWFLCFALHKGKSDATLDTPGSYPI